MTFDEVLAQVQEVLQRQQRVSYRGLKRRFGLDDEYIEDLKEELIGAKRIATDEEGRFLVWIGDAGQEFSVQSPGAEPVQSPKSKVYSQETQSSSAYTSSHLAERIRAEQLALEARIGVEEERKTITVLFADLKGSTMLIEGLDPEEARAIIDPALQIMMDAVHQYDGYVAQALGDGIFALFGAPIAHEDHPQRALYAALRMQEEMRRYGDHARLKYGAPLTMRVGVNTGEVVVRSIRKDDLHADYVPVGHSTNLAARMEQMATPGSILVTAYTYKLTEGYFAFKALGQAQIKGMEDPLSIYEVLGVGQRHTRLQVSESRRGLTRFVGRHREMEQMRDALTQAKAGHGQVVGVIGEPGLGKSRLFHEFVRAQQVASLLVLQSYAVSHGQTSPYLPVIELLKGYFDIQNSDSERKRREKVTGKVLTLDRSLEDTLPYLFALLGSEEPPSPLQHMDPQIRRRRMFEALKRLFLRESLNQPLILIFEDLHWLDGETQGFLDTLSEGVASAKILLLVNYRPEYRHEWGQKTFYTQLRLAPFGQAEAEEFLDVLLSDFVGPFDRSTLPDLKRIILEKTEGTPFFMEEIVQDLTEQGVLVRDSGGVRRAAPLPVALHLPTTVQGILAARIDRLASDEKTLLQQLAVIGREFPFSLVKQILTQPEDELYRLLSSLQHKEFLYEQPAFPEGTYLFKHALTQEVAYNSVLIERRKGWHEQIARALEQLHHDRLEDHYRELAHHYSRSGNVEKAIEYFSLAGQQAAHNSAHREAVSHFMTALDVLKNVPETPERIQRELRLLLPLAASLQVTQGPSALEVGEVYARARILCQQGGDERQLFAVLRGMWLLHHVQADLSAARETGEQLLVMAERIGDSSLILEARRTLGSTLLWQGDFLHARTHLEQAVALYDRRRPDAPKSQHGGANPGIVCLCELARVLWFLGYPDQALLSNQAAVTFARNDTDPFTLGFALIFAAGLHQLCRYQGAEHANLEEGIAIARKHGFPALLSAGTIRQGWVLAEQGDEEEGLRRMQQGLAARQEAGAELAQPYFLALQAEVYGKLGQREHALTVISEALAALYASGEHRLEAELCRIKGQLTLQKKARDWELEAKEEKRPASQYTDPLPLTPDPQTEAEEYFLKAIEIARKQHAKSLELRATVSLARLWQQQGKALEAHRLLFEVYTWFTEGFDTKDLQEAKALLDALSSERGFAVQ